jgi:hypothetical protein
MASRNGVFDFRVFFGSAGNEILATRATKELLVI